MPMNTISTAISAPSSRALQKTSVRRRTAHGEGASAREGEVHEQSPVERDFDRGFLVRVRCVQEPD